MLLTKYGNRSCRIQKEIDGRRLIAISHLRVSGDLHVKRIIKLLFRVYKQLQQQIRWNEWKSINNVSKNMILVCLHVLVQFESLRWHSYLTPIVKI